MTNDELKTSARSAANVEFVIRNLVNPAIRRALGLVALSGYRISNTLYRLIYLKY